MTDALDIRWLRNVANAGRGSAMTEALHAAADEIERLTAERDELRRQLDECSQMLARQAATIRDLESKLRSADAAERSINEALNSGDGSYRP